MEYAKENSTFWDSSYVHILRWIIFIPVGLGLFWLVETFFNILITRVLGWDLNTVLFYTVYIVGGCLLFLAMILATGLIRTVIGYITPSTRIGCVLLAIVYLIIQIVMLYQLVGKADLIWPFVLSKIEITGIVLFMFLFTKQEIEGQPDTDLSA